MKDTEAKLGVPMGWLPPWLRGRGPTLLLSVVMLLALVAFLSSAFFLQRQMGGLPDRSLTLAFTWMIGSFTLVILALAGALVVWIGSLAGQRASRAQAQKMVDALNGLEDGFVALDAFGFVTGLNRKARSLSAVPLRPRLKLENLFPVLTQEEAEALLRPTGSQEIRKTAWVDGTKHTYRFRCYPTGDLRLIFLSDISREQDEVARREHEAGMQLIGRIAQGVAHDFNNILCAILGHAELLGLPNLNAETSASSLRTIAYEASRGANLARQLVDLSRPAEDEDSTVEVREILTRAAAMLQRADPARAWEIRPEIEQASWKSRMPSSQIEQLVIRFGLQAMDGHDTPGVVRIACRSPSVDGVFRGPAGCVAVLIIAGMPKQPPCELSALSPDPVPPLSRDGGGLIQSVVLSVLERSGGSMELLRQPDGYPAYRIYLPGVEPERPAAVAASGTDPLVAFRGWSILLVEPPGGGLLDVPEAEQALRWNVSRANNMVAALDRAEKGGVFHAVLLDDRLLGEDPNDVLRRIRRSSPAARCLVMTAGGQAPWIPPGEATAARRGAPLAELLAALAAAR